MAFHLEEKLHGHGASALQFFSTSNPERAKPFRYRHALIIGLALTALTLAGAAAAQPSLGGDNVSWSASAPAQAVKPGAKVKITVKGAVKSGWHVYGLDQLPDGPTPLKVSVDASDVAAADGAPLGSPTIKLQDPSFNLQTQFYEHDFTVTAPVRIGAHAAAGQQQVPVSVRFQTCNGGICQPPKTVRLSVPVNVRANG